MFTEFLQSRGLSIERLHALVLLSEKGSLIRAAGGNSGRQSRYSHHLRELSAFFGTALTEQSGKTIRLTPAGEDLARLAREQLQALQNFQRRLKPETREWRMGAGDSLMQWLLIPALGAMRRPTKAERFVVQSLGTDEIVTRVKEQQLDFGLVRSNAVVDREAAEEICTVRYAIVVPRRLLRGYTSIKTALLACPHAAVAGDGQLTRRLKELAIRMGGLFRPELLCDSLGQCLAAIGTGCFAAVIPAHAVESEMSTECTVVDDGLEDLNQTVSFIWNRRTLDVLGDSADRVCSLLKEVLREEAVQRGIGGEVTT